jgi:hypothetical protein
MKKRSPAWPDELKKPIVAQDLWRAATAFTSQVQDSEQAFRDEFAKEVFTRMDVLAQFFGYPGLPESDQDWRSLLWSLCEHWSIPAFQIVERRPRGRGADKVWTDEKHCQLFADVQSLVATSRISEHAACIYIAKNPARFEGRYRRPKQNDQEAWAKTLHRQFITSKKRAKEDFGFRMIYFGQGLGLLRPVPEWPELVQVAIKQYAVARK